MARRQGVSTGPFRDSIRFPSTRIAAAWQARRYAVLRRRNAAWNSGRGVTVPIFVAVLGLALLSAILWDAFETIILPRRVTRAFRLARGFYRSAWTVWAGIGRRIKTVKRRESYLSSFGPLSLLMLFALWAIALVFGFAMLQWAAGPTVSVSGETASFWTDLYMSGTTFFTLGIGDVTPQGALGRAITVCEAGIGFGFLAIIISYLPTLYGSFSQREVNISLLDARAGAPPTAGELLRRHGRQRIADGLGQYLRDWETWSAQLMETHLTYPVLCYFRSQHDNQSWLSSFAAILDVCALLIAYGEGEVRWQAQLTFAISRHAVADLCQIFKIHPHPFPYDRLPCESLPLIRSLLMECGVPQCVEAGDRKLRELRRMYEPYLNGLSKRLLMPIPGWGVGGEAASGRGKTVWERISAGTPAAEFPEGDEIGHL
jgi:Ion channel